MECSKMVDKDSIGRDTMSKWDSPVLDTLSSMPDDRIEDMGQLQVANQIWIAVAMPQTQSVVVLVLKGISKSIVRRLTWWIIWLACLYWLTESSQWLIDVGIRWHNLYYFGVFVSRNYLVASPWFNYFLGKFVCATLRNEYEYASKHSVLQYCSLLEVDNVVRTKCGHLGEVTTNQFNPCHYKVRLLTSI